MSVRGAEVAYYYPAPYWGPAEGGWVKSLLLFFDQVAILLPGYMYGSHRLADPSLAGPLEDAGLLRVVEPNHWLDQELAEGLAEVMVELITNGAFDDLETHGYYHQLSYSRMGYGADVQLGEMLVEELMARSLAKPSEDGVSIPLHPDVRTTVLVILAQLARLRGQRANLLVSPATSHAEAVRDLIRTLSRDGMASSGHVVTLDLEPVGLDLDLVPLDEVLGFREAHHKEHQSYMRNLRRFLAELAGAEPEARTQLLVERQVELAETAHVLRRTARLAFGKNLASWSLGIAGGVWAAAAKDPLGIALSAVGLIPGVIPDPKQVSAYSYLFTARSAFGGGA